MRRNVRKPLNAKSRSCIWIKYPSTILILFVLNSQFLLLKSEVTACNKHDIKLAADKRYRAPLKVVVRLRFLNYGILGSDSDLNSGKRSRGAWQWPEYGQVHATRAKDLSHQRLQSYGSALSTYNKSMNSKYRFCLLDVFARFRR